MKSQICLLAILYAIVTSIVTVESNSEGNALYAWKVVLSDPNNVLESWDPKLVNPCTWFHVTCNSDNSVTRVDLGNGGLSGPLVPQLDILTNLQYLQVEGNRIYGSIPREIGNLTNLISLGLQHNQLSGTIPSSLGNLKSLRFMRLNSNNLTGEIPLKVIRLISTGDLRELDVSDNFLAGTLRQSNKTVTTTVIQDARI